MTKIDSLIAGLTMLRAYGGVEAIAVHEPNSIGVAVASGIDMHADDLRRMKSDGWVVADDSDKCWVFECD